MATEPKRCLDCGYILDYLPENRCPECGRAFDPADPRSYGPPRSRWWRFATGRWPLRLVIVGIAYPLLACGLVQVTLQIGEGAIGVSATPRRLGAPFESLGVLLAIVTASVIVTYAAGFFGLAYADELDRRSGSPTQARAVKAFVLFMITWTIACGMIGQP